MNSTHSVTSIPVPLQWTTHSTKRVNISFNRKRRNNYGDEHMASKIISADSALDAKRLGHNLKKTKGGQGMEQNCQGNVPSWD